MIPEVGHFALIIALCLALILAIVPAYLSRMYLAWYFNKWIGGYTGDCLGTVQQVSESMFYISVLALCVFI